MHEKLPLSTRPRAEYPSSNRSIRTSHLGIVISKMRLQFREQAKKITSKINGIQVITRSSPLKSNTLNSRTETINRASSHVPMTFRGLYAEKDGSHIRGRLKNPKFEYNHYKFRTFMVFHIFGWMRD